MASTVYSKSSREMLEALIAAVSDPVVLADMAKGRMRPKIPQLQQALAGHFGAHHGVVARQILDHLDFLDRSIATLTDQIATRLVPFDAAVSLLVQIPGIERLTAEVFVAETGADMSRFPPLPSWPLGLGWPQPTTSPPDVAAQLAPATGVVG